MKLLIRIKCFLGFHWWLNKEHEVMQICGWCKKERLGIAA